MKPLNKQHWITNTSKMIDPLDITIIKVSHVIFEKKTTLGLNLITHDLRIMSIFLSPTQSS